MEDKQTNLLSEFEAVNEVRKDRVAQNKIKKKM
jgi:hypothetical protein